MDELLLIGIVPVEPLVYDPKEYDCVWNSSEVKYELVELDEEESIESVCSRTREVADWKDFDERFSQLNIF